MEVLVPGMEETAVRTCIPGYHGPLSPMHRHEETPNRNAPPWKLEDFNALSHRSQDTQIPRVPAPKNPKS